MSKHETPLILRYWESVGGTLIEEFMLVSRKPGQGQRLADAVIIPDAPKQRLPRGQRKFDLRDRDIIVVQAKAGRLGMYLMGQTLFSKHLLERYHHPRSVRAVALCGKGDTVLEDVAAGAGIDVVLYEQA